MTRLARYLACFSAALISATATAAEPAFAEAESANGAVIRFYNDARHCVGRAKYAEWQSADATERVPACWLLAGAIITLAYSDGDMGHVPTAQLRKPKDA